MTVLPKRDGKAADFSFNHDPLRLCSECFVVYEKLCNIGVLLDQVDHNNHVEFARIERNWVNLYGTYAVLWIERGFLIIQMHQMQPTLIINRNHN
ncbi:hypothetical protein JTB14_034884 [Gonioctena quinquepunctata]|nr:hypothetical protein JTB14_034884 [Gonioctena quinquepunctata]